MPRRRSSRVDAQVARERREQKLAELHEQLTAGIARLTSSDEWVAWLRVASRFHSYSFNNTLLIHAQRSDATRVAGYQVWRQLGRQVGKGERGIQILAPIIRRPRADSTASVEPDDGDPDVPMDEKQAAEERRSPQRVGFRVAHVFDVSQTSGAALPEPERLHLVAGQAPAGLWDQLAAQVDERGFTVQRGECGGQRNGYTNFLDRLVLVRGDVDDAQAVKTLAHELGHVLMHGPDQLAARDTRVCRGTAEVEAESVAYLVASARGLDVSGYTFPYVARWAAGVGDGHADSVADIVQRTAVHVLGTAHQVVARLEESVTPATREAADAALRNQAGKTRTSTVRHRAEALQGGLEGHGVPDRANVHRAVERTLAANAAAVGWWAEQLRSSDAAGPRQYLADRGVAQVLDAALPWQVGYADSKWTSLVDHLRASGFTDSELLDAGLAITTRKGNVVDRFRERIMLPIRRPDGDVVGFIGRAAPAAPPDVPKYLNTPSTAAFTKGDHLFGLAEQADTIRTGRAMLVEGPFDVLAVAGARPDTAAVAPCGTALTERQVTVLAQYAPRVAVALDADPAGLDATVRAYDLLRVAYRDPEWVQLPAGADPADLAAAGDGQLTAALDQEPRPLADAAVEHAVAIRDPTNAEQVVAATRRAAITIAGLPVDHVARQVARVAQQLDLEVDVVTQALTDAFTRVHGAAVRPAAAARRRGDPVPPRTPAAVRAVAHLPRTGSGARSSTATAVRPQDRNPIPFAAVVRQPRWK